MITPSASSIRGRWVTGSMPIITASEISAPGPTPSMARPLRQVVELHEAVGDDQRVVVRQADDARAEPDALGALARRGEEHGRVGDVLPRRRVVLADPGLVEARARRSTR